LTEGRPLPDRRECAFRFLSQDGLSIQDISSRAGKRLRLRGAQEERGRHIKDDY